MSVTALGFPSPSWLFTLIGETIIKIKTIVIVNRKRLLTKILPTGEMMMVMRVVMTSGSYDGDNDEEPMLLLYFLLGEMEEELWLNKRFL